MIQFIVRVNIMYIIAGLCLIAILPLPYIYYQVLRFIACGGFAWAAYMTFENDMPVMPWICIVFAIIFNPIIPVHSTKTIWIIIDLCAALFLIFVRRKLR